MVSLTRSDASTYFELITICTNCSHADVRREPGDALQATLRGRTLAGNIPCRTRCLSSLSLWQHITVPCPWCIVLVANHHIHIVSLPLLHKQHHLSTGLKANWHVLSSLVKIEDVETWGGGDSSLLLIFCWKNIWSWPDGKQLLPKEEHPRLVATATLKRGLGRFLQPSTGVQIKLGEVQACNFFISWLIIRKEQSKKSELLVMFGCGPTPGRCSIIWKKI